MKNVKYYILAYSMLIYLFLEKYITLLYLLIKVHCIDENKNGITITYVHKRINYFITINIYILKDVENKISFNTYERYDEMYAPLFYNEYKQLFYHDYFIGE